MNKSSTRKIAVIGLGYVGLPVAMAFARNQSVIGYDKNPQRILDLQNGLDCTEEIDTNELRTNQLKLTSNSVDLNNADFYIIAVPTPINHAKHPDLSYLLSASEIVGKYLNSGDIVVYESTVYPGATEEDCAPVLEAVSGLKSGKDFFLGYSPERINPGDSEHRFETITKVVAGQNKKTLDIIAELYESVVTAGIYRAPNIKTAEAAKVIENTQRDINIAFMNELAIIFNRMGIDTQEVLSAASTKWNFMSFKPGLVGGHCIGVDPYYLTYQAQRFGYQPEVILAGRRINDNVGKYIASQTIKQMIHKGCSIKGANVAVLGLTFKENCPDLRNTRVIDIINELKSYDINCLVHGAKADPKQAKKLYGLDLVQWDEIKNVDAIVIAVGHDEYGQLTPADYQEKFNSHAIIIDVKAILNPLLFKEAGISIWRL